MMNSVSHPFVSVIIPVLNQSRPLQLCLQALAQQTYPQHCYEVIVVDNGSDIAENIAGVVAQFGQAIITHESRPGSYAARNKGIALARGAVLAFTDADCIPANDWIEQGVNHLLQVANCGLVAGKIEIYCQDPSRPTMVELYESLRALPQQEFLEQHHYGATANLFTWTTVFEQVGNFNASLKSSGDREWGQRVYAHGYPQVYSEMACVRHPARHSFQQLYKRTIRLAGGVYDLQRQHSGWQRHYWFFKELIQDLIPPVIFTLNTFSNAQLTSLGQKLQVSIVFAYVRYVRAGELIKLRLGGESARE